MELDDALAEEPRFLVDGRFLAALHGEMRERLGADEAQTALLQLGFLHGLRDATRALSAGGVLGGGPGAASWAACHRPRR